VHMFVKLLIFTFFIQRNGTSWSDGELSMHTGEDDIALLGRVATWNGRTRTAAFPGECGRLRGSSDGLLAPGYLAMRDEFQIWSTDSCRPLTFVRCVRKSAERPTACDINFVEE
jgi:hypothetical protein